MNAAQLTGGNGLTKKINIFCLLAAVVIVLVLPLRKEIWYDETVSILCAKGISHDTPSQFGEFIVLNSTVIEQFNSSSNVFTATVADNGNSFLYNLKLHWFTRYFGNTIPVYMLLSKLCAIITLIAFFFLCRQFFKDALFTGVTILLLVADLNFINMSHEIRAYSMCTMFITLAALFFFRFLWQQEKPLYLLLTSFFSVCALLCHFLVIYIIVVFLITLLVVKGKKIFSTPNVLSILLPLIPLLLYFYYAWSGLGVMNSQSNTIQEGFANLDFQLSEVFFRSMSYAAMDFKMVFPAGRSSGIVIALSFALVIALYLTALWAAPGKPEKNKLHLFFALGISGTILLLVLSIRSHHYASLYYRYHSFALPFATLFVGYLLYIICYSARTRSFIKIGLPLFVVIPVLALFADDLWFHRAKPSSPYAFIEHEAAAIIKNKQTSIQVSDWRDAFLIQSLLPSGYKIDYFRR